MNLEHLIKELNTNGEGAWISFKKIAGLYVRILKGSLMLSIMIIPLVFALAYSSIIYKSLNIPILVVIMVVVGFSQFMIYNLLKVAKEYFKIKKKFWLPAMSEVIFSSRDIQILLAMAGIESSVIFILFGFLVNIPLVILIPVSILLLANTYLIVFLRKYLYGKRGHVFGRIFKVPVNDIANAVSTITGEKKKKHPLLSGYYNMYIFKIPQHNITIQVSRYMNYSSFTSIIVSGIKEDNLFYVKELIQKTNEIIEKAKT